MQRRFLEADLAFWADALHRPMDTDNIYVCYWQLGPFSVFLLAQYAEQELRVAESEGSSSGLGDSVTPKARWARPIPW